MTDLIARFGQFVFFWQWGPRSAAHEARSISQIARLNAKICRLGSDQDARLSWVWEKLLGGVTRDLLERMSLPIMYHISKNKISKADRAALA
jgi:hypothetical protein